MNKTQLVRRWPERVAQNHPRNIVDAPMMSTFIKVFTKKKVYFYHLNNNHIYSFSRWKNRSCENKYKYERELVLKRLLINQLVYSTPLMLFSKQKC